jgi:hypothetical protein
MDNDKFVTWAKVNRGIIVLYKCLQFAVVCGIITSASITAAQSTQNHPNQHSNTLSSGVATSAPVATPAVNAIPAGTPVIFNIIDPISSKTNKVGETFRIKLTEAIIVNGNILIPAGSEGQGEIVHIAKARAMGKAGELILAARYIEHQEQKILLRSFRFSSQGDNKTNAAMVASYIAGPAALFVVGGEVNVPTGTIGQAKTASDIVINVN